MNQRGGPRWRVGLPKRTRITGSPTRQRGLRLTLAGASGSHESEGWSSLARRAPKTDTDNWEPDAPARVEVNPRWRVGLPWIRGVVLAGASGSQNGHG